MNKIFNIECRHRFWQNKLWYVDAYIDFQNISLYNKIYQIKQLLKWICRRENFSVLLIYSHICKVNKNILVLFNKKNLKTDIESMPFSLPDIKKSCKLTEIFKLFLFTKSELKVVLHKSKFNCQDPNKPRFVLFLIRKRKHTYIHTYMVVWQAILKRSFASLMSLILTEHLNLAGMCQIKLTLVNIKRPVYIYYCSIRCNLMIT